MWGLQQAKPESNKAGVEAEGKVGFGKTFGLEVSVLGLTIGFKKDWGSTELRGTASLNSDGLSGEGKALSTEGGEVELLVAGYEKETTKDLGNVQGLGEKTIEGQTVEGEQITTEKGMFMGIEAESQTTQSGNISVPNVQSGGSKGGIISAVSAGDQASFTPSGGSNTQMNSKVPLVGVKINLGVRVEGEVSLTLPTSKTPANPRSGIDWTKTCFIAGTKVLMSDGEEKNIEEIVVGDKILSVNMKTMEIESDEVVIVPNTIEYYSQIDISFSNGLKISCSPHHPIFVKGKGWSVYDVEMAEKDLPFNVSKIEEGDTILFYSEGKLKTAVISSIYNTNKKVEMYNIKYVKKNNTFFANGILVHNRFKN